MELQEEQPRKFIRIAWNIEDKHPEWQTFAALLLMANRQAPRGRFKRLDALIARFGTEAVDRMKVREDLVLQPDGTWIVQGWDRWQEGDVTADMRMQRYRAGNPLIAKRENLERRGLELIRLISGRTNEEPTLILARCSTGGGRFKGSAKVRLDTMHEDRLALTVNDLEQEWLKVKPAEDRTTAPQEIDAEALAEQFRTGWQFAPGVRGDRKLFGEAFMAWAKTAGLKSDADIARVWIVVKREEGL